KKLEPRWKVTYRWELFAIFIVFAVTGSSAAKLSDPFLNLIGLYKDTVNSSLFWTLRILLVFPIYQILLVCYGWLFGQFDFFWAFEKKMLKRMGFKRFFKD
ncbi:MAG: prolipoprotein diacylglyceryl transferase, partial [Flavobacteriaceae bacterium]|nr:prolipoprotein diacylglyceryl transferase [Flavobacteriaceae bacterium]